MKDISPISKTSANEGKTKQAPFFKPMLQAKLSINQPNDIYEQEADAMADKVMRMTDNDLVQTKFFKPAVFPIQRKCAHCEEEQRRMQRKEMNEEETIATNEMEKYVDNLNNNGQPLPSQVRNFYEPRFGYDFSNVKIHTDSVAAKSAQSINALAFTSGNNIVFNSGEFAPNTDSGKRLLGHELTHVIQQNNGLNRKTIQRDICTAPSVLLNMASLPGTAGNISSVAGQVAEMFIIRDYCRTGCAPMVTEYFDNPIVSSYIAFLAAHNPHLNITQLALIALGGGFQRPDILVDKGLQKEMYEIKPRSPDGILAGIAKLLNLQAFMSVFSLPYITGILYTPTNPLARVNVTVGSYNLTVSIMAYRIAPGLIVYEFCFSEALAWAILLVALIIALIILAPEIAAALAALVRALAALFPELIPILQGSPVLIPLLGR